MSSIVCPDLQSAPPEFSLPEIVMAVPGATTPPGFPWIVRVVRATELPAKAIPPDRTKEREITNSDATISFRLAPFIPAPASGSRQAPCHAIPEPAGRQLVKQALKIRLPPFASLPAGPRAARVLGVMSAGRRTPTETRTRTWARVRVKRLRPWWRRRWVRWSLTILGALTFVALLDAVWVATTATRELRSARDPLQRGASSLVEGRIDDARA